MTDEFVALLKCKRAEYRALKGAIQRGIAGVVFLIPAALWVGIPVWSCSSVFDSLSVFGIVTLCVCMFMVLGLLMLFTDETEEIPLLRLWREWRHPYRRDRRKLWRLFGQAEKTSEERRDVIQLECAQQLKWTDETAAQQREQDGHSKRHRN